MSVAFKIVSLGVRTLAKPIGNYIKHQAREHEGFRRICVSFAQQLHRIDMRMRLGLLQDPAVIERQIKREQEEAERKKNPGMKPTAKTKEEAEADDKERDELRKKLKKGRPIKPLSEGKAIDSGATFISEGFLFLVAGGLILLEQWRSKRKDTARRDEFRERLDSLEGEIDSLRSENRTLRIDGAVGPKVAASQASKSAAESTQPVQDQTDKHQGDKDGSAPGKDKELKPTTESKAATSQGSQKS